MKIAEANISEGNLEFQHASAQKVPPRKQIQYAKSLIDMGLERKQSLKSVIKTLKKQQRAPENNR